MLSGDGAGSVRFFDGIKMIMAEKKALGGFSNMKWAFKNMLPAEKKYPKECEEARQDSFRRILAFLEGWN